MYGDAWKDPSVPANKFSLAVYMACPEMFWLEILFLVWSLQDANLNVFRRSGMPGKSLSHLLPLGRSGHLPGLEAHIYLLGRPGLLFQD